MNLYAPDIDLAGSKPFHHVAKYTVRDDQTLPQSMLKPASGEPDFKAALIECNVSIIAKKLRHLSQPHLGQNPKTETVVLQMQN